MEQKLVLIFTILFIINLNAIGQNKLEKFRYDSSFNWVVDSLDSNVILYYEKNSLAEKHSETLKSRIKQHLTNTMHFIGIETYDNPIHYFILEDRQRMKLLLGYETNGNANPKYNYITAIYSEKIKSVYSNHELFHLIAMNLWGNPERWINEGMAVYSDNNWHGHPLHEFSKHIIDDNKYIPIDKIARRLGKYESTITYPLLGSFSKFIDETYGREATRIIWTKGRRKMKRHIGKNLDDLEKEWLEMLETVEFEKIEYSK